MEDYLWLYRTYDVFASYYTGIKIDYICIYTILAISTLYYSKQLSISQNQKWWRYAIIYSLIFAIIEGIRYLRGTDYLNYALYYKYEIQGYPTEFIYNILQFFFHQNGFPFWLVLTIYAFCWIICFLILIKQEKKHIKYILPFTIVFSLQGLECFVRQSFAFSFLFLFILYLLRKEYIKSILFALISLSIHNGSIIFILIITSIYIIKNKVINLKLYIIAYILSTFIIEAQFLILINKIALIFPFIDNSLIGGYLSNAEGWFGDEAFKDEYSRGIISKLMVALFDIPIMALTFKAIKRNKKDKTNIVFYYNLFCITNILLQLFYNYELLKRTFMTFYMFGGFLFAFIMQFPPRKKYELLTRQYFIFFIIIYYIKTTLLAGNQMFIWDAIGKYNFNL